jgi:K+-transporting ATPase ATPase B chain
VRLVLPVWTGPYAQTLLPKVVKRLKLQADIDTLLLDKTGTITIGNRKATNFWSDGIQSEKNFIEACVLASLADETPEGKSIIELAETKGFSRPVVDKNEAHFVEFTAETRSSGIDMPNMHIRKGAFDAIKNKVEIAGNKISPFIINKTKEIAGNGGTPLVLSYNDEATGVIELQDYH